MIEAFYPVCAPPLTRRQFFISALGAGLAGALTAAGSAARETDPEVRWFIERYVMTPADPWALVHAIRGVGAGYRINGEPLAAYVVCTCVRVQEVQKRRYLYIPAAIEVHSNMFLKTFLEAGVPASKPFVCDARVCHLQDLGAGANALFRFDPHTFDRNDLAWSLIALAQLQAVKLFRADAKLKVLGHALECLGYAQTHRLFRPSVRAQHQIAQAAQAVRDLLAEVVTLDLAAIRPRQAQLVQQVIGDACHAFWGLNLVSREGEQRCSRRDNTGRNAMGGVGRGG